MLVFILLCLQLLSHHFLLILRELAPVNIFLNDDIVDGLRLLHLLTRFFLLFCGTILLILIRIFLHNCHFFRLSLPLLWNSEVPLTLFSVISDIGVVVAAVRTTSMDNNDLEIVVDEVGILHLCLRLLSLLQVLAHVDLKWVLEAVVDFYSIPSHHVVLDACQVQCHHRW